MFNGHKAVSRFEGLATKALTLLSKSAAPVEHDFAPDLLRGPAAANGATDGMVGLTHFLCTYDFAVLGATSPITIPTKMPFPALVIDGIVNVVTSLATATNIALSIVGANDLYSSAAITGWTGGTLIPLVPDPATATNAIKTTSSKCQVVVTTTGSALTAGKFHVILRVVPLVS